MMLCDATQMDGGGSHIKQLCSFGFAHLVYAGRDGKEDNACGRPFIAPAGKPLEPGPHGLPNQRSMRLRRLLRSGRRADADGCRRAAAVLRA